MLAMSEVRRASTSSPRAPFSDSSLARVADAVAEISSPDCCASAMALPLHSHCVVSPSPPRATGSGCTVLAESGGREIAF